MENLSVVLTLFICIFDFFEIKNSIIKIIVNGFMVGVNALLLCFIRKDIVKGANLKKYFDYSLFGFSGITKDLFMMCWAKKEKIIIIKWIIMVNQSHLD